MQMEPKNSDSLFYTPTLSLFRRGEKKTIRIYIFGTTKGADRPILVYVLENEYKVVTWEIMALETSISAKKTAPKTHLFSS